MRRLICPDCGSSSYLIVDGQEMTEHELLALRKAPRSIKRRLPHAVWCPSFENRMNTLTDARAVMDEATRETT